MTSLLDGDFTNKEQTIVFDKYKDDRLTMCAKTNTVVTGEGQEGQLAQKKACFALSYHGSVPQNIITLKTLELTLELSC